MKKILILFILLVSVTFGQYNYPTLWKLSGTTLSPISSTWSLNGIRNITLNGYAVVDTIFGSTASGGNLFLSSTLHATKGKIFFGANSVYDQVNDRWGIGTTGPSTKLYISVGSGHALTIRKNYTTGSMDALNVLKPDGGPTFSITTDDSQSSISAGILAQFSSLGSISGAGFRIGAVNANPLLVKGGLSGGFVQKIDLETNDAIGLIIERTGAAQTADIVQVRSSSAATNGDLLTINAAGNVGIRQSTFLRSTKLGVTGMAMISDTLWVGNNSTYSYIKPGDASWTVSSDENLKTNIQNFSVNLANFDKVKPRSYNFKEELFLKPFDEKSLPDTLNEAEKLEARVEFRGKNLAEAEYKSSQEYIGFLAQEFNANLFGNNSKEIDYNKVIAVMWLKIQELESRVKALEEKK